jgi:hypothetical protein
MIFLMAWGAFLRILNCLSVAGCDEALLMISAGGRVSADSAAADRTRPLVIATSE